MTTRAKLLIDRANKKGALIEGIISFPSGTAVAFIDAFERLGYDRDSLLSNAALEVSQLLDADARISCEAIGRLFCAAMQQRPMKNLMTHLATATPIGAFPLLDYLVATSDTVGPALVQLARYIRMVGAPYLLDIRTEEDGIEVRYENDKRIENVEYGVAIALLHLRAETENRLTVSSIHFCHNPDDPAEIERILGCPVHGNQSWNGFVLSWEAWRLPMRRRDPILHGVLEQHAEGFVSSLPAMDPVVLEVRRALSARLSQGDIQIRSVARSLTTSARSLQRRLAAAGVTYQEVLDSIRREIASKYLLLATLSIAEVAYLLGYSEPAAFHRAFIRWNGIGPGAFRAQRQSQAHRT